MKILIFGGNGFVGLNIAAALLARGHAVTLFDRAGLPPAAKKDFTGYADQLTAIQGDVTDRQAIEGVIAAGHEAIVLGAAITAGPERDATDPENIIRVNLLAQVPILIAAQRRGVGRIINLSSAAAYGTSTFRNVPLDEETACDPVSLYAITKFASEKVAARLAALWQCEIVSVRLSAVFGPWERSNGVRDTLSPQAQILAAMQGGREAVLPRPGVRDWIFAPDVAEAVALLIEAERPKHQLYNISTSVNGRRCNGARSWPLCIPASFAGLRKPVKRRRSTCIVPLTVRRFRSRALRRSSAGARDSAAPIPLPI